MEKYFEILRDDILEIKKEVKSININGCSKRNGDMIRIEHVEMGMLDLSKKMDKLFYTTLVTAVGIIAFLFKAFLPYLVNK